MFLMLSLMLEEEPSDSNDVLVAKFDGKEKAKELQCCFC